MAHVPGHIDDRALHGRRDLIANTERLVAYVLDPWGLVIYTREDLWEQKQTKK